MDKEKFFERVGDHALHPKYFGECIWPITLEEIYQAFKARMEAERAADQTSEVKP